METAIYFHYGVGIFREIHTGWWLAHPSEKKSSNWKSSPTRGEHKKYVKPPTRIFQKENPNISLHGIPLKHPLTHHQKIQECPNINCWLGLNRGLEHRVCWKILRLWLREKFLPPEHSVYGQRFGWKNMGQRTPGST